MRKLCALLACVSTTAVVLVAASPAGAAPAASAVSSMSPSSSTAVAAINRSNEKTAFDFFVSKGLSKKQAAGIVGNLDQESGVNPKAKQSGGAGRGIAQWSVGGRWNKSSPNDVHYTNVTLKVSRYNLTGQLKFIWDEFTKVGYGYSELKKATTVKKATTIFESKYELCGDCNTAAREKYASDAYNRYK